MMRNENLITAREEKGWTQEKAAEKIGVSRVAYARWEEKGILPRLWAISKACEVFHMAPEQLGFKKPMHKGTSHVQTSTLQIVPATHTTIDRDNTESDDMNRRQALQAMLGVATGNAFLNVFDPDLLERLSRVLKRPSSIDETMLFNLEALSKFHWQLHASTEGVAQYQRDMLYSVSGHLHTLIQLLGYAHSSQTRERLSYLASEATQLIGEIVFFDLGDKVTAEKYYDVALEAAKEANSTMLQAVVLGRKSFLSIYGEKPQEAIPLLHEAQRKAATNTSDIIRGWLSAAEAEASANAYELSESLDPDSSLHALRNAEFFLERAHLGETAFAFEGESGAALFSQSKLRGYKGACLLRLHHPAEAQAVLNEDIAFMSSPSRVVHKSVTLVDLAMAYVQQGEIDEACRTATQALDLVDKTKSAVTFQRVYKLRDELETWKSLQCVRNLNEQITVLST